jgi:hypothetical protein
MREIESDLIDVSNDSVLRNSRTMTNMTTEDMLASSISMAVGM